MAWIRIQQSLPSHRKILQLADILEIHPAQAMGHMTAFWLWALDSTPHGGLEGISPRMIARSALWDGIPDDFFNALLKVRFLEQEGGEIRIRNWEVYAGPLVKSREDGRERAIQQREREKAKREAEADDLKIINENLNYSTHTVREPYANSTQIVCPREEKRREEKIDQNNNTSLRDSSSSNPLSDQPQDEKGKPDPFEAEITMYFKQFWTAYPLKKDKRAAEKAFIAVFKGAGKSKKDLVLKNMEAHMYDYIDSVEGVEHKFIKHPATWLRAQDFLEPPPEPEDVAIRPVYLPVDDGT